MPVVTFVNEFRHVEVSSGTNLRTAALEAGVSIDRQHFLGLSCKNRGLCGQCKVWVREQSTGATSPRTWMETGLFFRRLRGWSRLACQVKVLGDIEVWTVAGGPDRLHERPIDPPPKPGEHAATAAPPKAPAEAAKPSETPKSEPPAPAATEPAAT